MAVKAGDRLNVSATYDTRKASWYESMGIMVVFYADGTSREAKDPFASKVDWRGLLTHGHLRENDNHGGKRRARLPDARDAARRRRSAATCEIKGFIYERGDLLLSGQQRPAAAGQGRPVADLHEPGRHHDDVGRRSPRTTRSPPARPPVPAPPASPIRSPTRKVQFDSGELGLRARRLHPGGQPQHLADAEEPEGRHLHLLLPHPPVHARRLPGRAGRQAEGLTVATR